MVKTLFHVVWPILAGLVHARVGLFYVQLSTVDRFRGQTERSRIILPETLGEFEDGSSGVQQTFRLSPVFPPVPAARVPGYCWGNLEHLK
jgi:hypothetical protein